MNNTPILHLYLVQAHCWSCFKPVKVAMLKGATPQHFYGPEAFNPHIIGLATSHGAVIQPQFSRKKQTTQPGNTCPNCKAYIGEHYLFTEYFMTALDGQYGYEKVAVEMLNEMYK